MSNASIKVYCCITTIYMTYLIALQVWAVNCYGLPLLSGYYPSISEGPLISIQNNFNHNFINRFLLAFLFSISLHRRNWYLHFGHSVVVSLSFGLLLFFPILTSIGNSIVEIRRSYDRLISTMGFPILVRCHLYIESGPRSYKEHVVPLSIKLYIKWYPRPLRLGDSGFS